jgi:hypothetical protein
MRKISFIIVIMFACFSHSQTIIRKKNTTAFYTDHFSVNKNTLQKHGQFIRMSNLKSDTLISGLYDNDKRIGRWRFFDITGNLQLQYDYDNNTFTHIADTIKNIKKFSIRTDSTFRFTNVDRPPLYLSDTEDLYRTIATGFVLPAIISKKKITGRSVASFEIDDNGKLSNIEINQTLHPELDKAIISVIEKLENNWQPAIKNGKPIVTCFLVVVNVLRSNEPVPQIIEQPHIMFLTVQNSGYKEIRFR